MQHSLTPQQSPCPNLPLELNHHPLKHRMSGPGAWPHIEPGFRFNWCLMLNQYRGGASDSRSCLERRTVSSACNWWHTDNQGETSLSGNQCQMAAQIIFCYSHHAVTDGYVQCIWTTSRVQPGTVWHSDALKINSPMFDTKAFTFIL